MRFPWSSSALLLCLLVALARTASAQEDAAADDEFARDIRPLLEAYCFACHGAQKQKAGIRFDQIDPDVAFGADAIVWDIARDMLGGGFMPPEDAAQPGIEERRTLIAWLNAGLGQAERAHEGELHTVLRRLNKAQYTHSLQELLGLSIDFGRNLPDDGKSKAGFTNNGDVLLASPLHLESYQAIARAAVEQALAHGDGPPPVTHYRVTFGRGIGVGLPASTTGGYQAVPLAPDDFVVDILGPDGAPRVGADEEQQAALDSLKRRITVGLRGSSQDRFHSVPEGVLLYSALPHKEVAPGSWQGPSPNMKLEMQRVFPDRGDFELRVRASRGYVVQEKKELLVELDAPLDVVGLVPADPREGAPLELEGVTEFTRLGPWYQAGPVFSPSASVARDTFLIDPARPLELSALLADGETSWRDIDDTDGQVRTYPDKIGVVWLARVIEAPSARRMDVTFGSDDGIKVWLNGDLVHDNDVPRGLTPDADHVALDLVAGRNELLVRILNLGGQFGSHHRVLHDGTSGGATPFALTAPEQALVLAADRSGARLNLRFEAGSLVPEDTTQESSARLSFEAPAGYYQFDLVHPASAPELMGSIRLSLAGSDLFLRPQLSPEQLAAGHVVTHVGAGYLKQGRHDVSVGGPFFTGFSHLVLTPLGQDHPLVMRLEAREEQKVPDELPALRAFIGTRTDDGMDYQTFGRVQEVEAPLGASRVYTFRGRLENLPIPEPDTGDDEILSGICVLGVWNDHLVHSKGETGPPLLVESFEFEAPFHPVWPPASHTRVFIDSPHRSDPERYGREVIGAFLERAFRRSVPEPELERYVAFWHALRDECATYEEGLGEVLIAALTSPSFLFLAEPQDARDADGRLAQEPLASRLAYFLWNSPPDDELTRVARAGRLREELGAQVERLLDDPRSERFVRAFTREWLRLDRFEEMTINPGRFPAFTRFVKRDMAEETYRFVDHVLARDLSLFTLVDSDFAMLNQNLAEFYGVDGVEGVAFRPVPVAPEAGRGGLLTHGAFLAGHSDGNEPHPIKRAVWVKEKLLGQPPLPPPPNVPELDPDAPGLEQLTLKERIEAHRDNPSCMDCHASFDPYGIALEDYNAVGLRQLERKGKPVDASVALPDGTRVTGAAGLAEYLTTRVPDAFAASVIEHLYAYALGRDAGFADEPELAAILEEVRSRGFGLRAVIHAIVRCPSFSR